MKTIWKFPLQLVDEQILNMPDTAHILTVQVQRDIPCLWAIVDPSDVSRRPRRVAIVGTGNPVPDWAHLGNYVSTFQLIAGSLIFHVFVTR